MQALHSPRYCFLRISVLLGLLAASTAASGQDLEGLFSSRDTAAYDGYRISRTFDKSKGAFGRSETVINRGNGVLARIEGFAFENSTRFALFSLLGKERKQLIVESYSGGAHCCTSYHIYDLGPRLRVLFDGDAYGPDDVGYSMKLIDLNHDGVYEFVQSVMTFDYFYASHARSVFPEVVFAFDDRTGKFRPANRAFSTYLLRDIKDKLQAADKLNYDLRGEPKADDVLFRQEYHHAFLNVTLAYLFSGNDSVGWIFFDRKYKLSDKEKLRLDLKRTLRESAVYRSIHSR